VAAPFYLGHIEFGMYQFPLPDFPVSASNHAICCQPGWESHPIIIMRRLFSSQRLCPQTQDYRVESSLRSYQSLSFLQRWEIIVAAAAWRITSMRRLNVAVDFEVECRK
jgi:hypothetical protein